MFSKDKLAEELKKKGWSRYKLSKESGIAQTTLRDIFGKKQVTPTLQTLEKIATALNIPVNNLLVEYPSPTVSNTDPQVLLSSLKKIEHSGQLTKEILNNLNIQKEIIKEETTLLENYNKLDTEDKNKVIDYTKLLSNQDKYKTLDNTTNEISATKDNVIEFNTKDNKKDDDEVFVPYTSLDQAGTTIACHDDDLTDEEKAIADQIILDDINEERFKEWKKKHNK